MVNYPLEFCPYCGTELEVVEWPTTYRCESCEEWVWHNAVLGCTLVVVDGDELLLVEDVRQPGAWTLPQGRPEIPETPREGAARELEEESGLTVDPDDLVYLYDSAKEVGEEMYMMGITYAVDRSDATGPLDADDDAIDARFWTLEEFRASEAVHKPMPNPAETRTSQDVGLENLHALARTALGREHTYADLFAEYFE